MQIEIASQGRVFQMKRTFLSPQQPPPPTPRGVVTDFSKQSRKRLLKLTARLKLDEVRTTFLTLTFSKCPTPVEAKECLKRFLMRVRRRAPQASGIWRMEFQERGAIHFHIVLFNLPYWAQRDLQRAWEECTKEDRSIIDIRLVKGGKRVMSYVSKYVAKTSQAAASPSLDSPTYQHAGEQVSVGRFWGYVNKDALPYAEIIRAVLTDTQVAYYLRWFISVNSNRSSAWGGLTAFLFCDMPDKILRKALEWAGATQFPSPQPHTENLASIFA